jgi:hypothetical protein
VLKKANINWTAKQLAKMVSNGSIKFDNAIQRSLCWDNNRKSLLIHSLIENYPVPPLYTVKSNNGVYDGLDGKQRATTIKEYINNEFALSDNIPEITLENGFRDNISGMYFDQLAEEIQDRIKDYSLTIYFFTDEITDDEIHELFYRLNNGKSMSSIELTRVKAKSIDTIRKIGKHPIFTEAITEKAIQKYTNEDIIIKAYITLFCDEKSLETKAIRPIMETADITEDQENQIDAVLTRIADAHTYINILIEKEEDTDRKKLLKKVNKRLYTRTHLISICPIVNQSIVDDISIDEFSEFLIDFFSGEDGATNSDIYNVASETGSAKPENVTKRLEVLQEAYNSYFVTDETEQQTEQQERTA